MKINETGYYKSKTQDIIYYIYENTYEDKDKFPLLVSTYEFYLQNNEGRNIYEDVYGNDIALEYLEDEIESVNSKFKPYTITNENDVIIEDKLSYEEKLDRIKTILDNSELSKKILKIIDG